MLLQPLWSEWFYESESDKSSDVESVIGAQLYDNSTQAQI